MTTKVRKTEDNTYIVYDDEDEFEYDEFLTFRQAMEYMDDMNEICSDSLWNDLDEDENE